MKIILGQRQVFILIIVLFCQSITTCFALTPEQIIVVANERARYSVELAKYYMKLRNIPSDNLVNIKAPEEEVCSREDYDKNIASPVKTFLKKNDPGGIGFIAWSPCMVSL